ncbi:ABC transporter ATP-binding protein [Geodermatophilus sp. SYSU D00804]
MAVIEVRGLTKRYGELTAVEDLTFTAEAGRVLGFLGPNGAGKTTTLRMLMGLVTPTSGRATVDGVAVRDLPEPVRTVGAVLSTGAFHPRRTGRGHLRVLAAMASLPAERVDEVLELVGLTDAADRRASGYSLGMQQRLGLAAALLGDPRVLVLDEPANGLDPDGIRWLRGFLRHLAAEGRTVLVSSHVLAEVESTVDDIVVIRSGRLVAQGPLADLVRAPETVVTVRTPQAGRLVPLLATAGAMATSPAEDRIEVRGLSQEAVAEAAAAAGIPLYALGSSTASLEDLFFSLVSEHGTTRTGDPR